jgi:hypothetical protein
MRYSLLSGIALLASAFSFAQHSVNWGPEIPVADGSVYGNVRPRLALTTGNLPVVIFGKSGNGDLHVAKGNGTGFGVPVAILPSGTGSYLAYWTGPDIAAYGDTVIAAFKMMPFEEGKVYAVRSVDGGLTFSDSIRVDDHDDGRAWMPALEMDANGNPVISYMVFDGSGQEPRYVIAHSENAGLSYSSQEPVCANEACDCCPSEMVIGGDKEVLLFRNNASNIRDIYGILSEDGGTTYDNCVNMEQLNWSVTSCPSTGPHGMWKGDTLFTVSASRVSGDYRVYIGSAAHDGTGLALHQQTMPPPPSGANGSQNYPRITGQNDTIVLVWDEKETSNSEVFCSVTVDGLITGLSTFKARVNVITTGIQTSPDVVYKDGFVHIVYQDAASGDVIYRKGTIVDVTGLSENSLVEASVYPNPSANGTFVIGGDAAKGCDLNITDLSGKTVAFTAQQTAGGVTISLGDTAASGAYVLTLERATGEQQQVKLLLQR